MTSRRTPLLLCVLDGFGEAAPGPGNAITVAAPRSWLELRQKWPTTLLQASGEDVGLPCGLMGNSEVGHLNIGAGRVVYQEITRIDREIREGRFQQNAALRSAIDHAVKQKSALHLFGLVSDGGVHSSDQHLQALLQMAKAGGLTGDQVVLHAFLDGRDTPPRSAQHYLAAVEGWMAQLGVGRIGTVVGRYYAMDRDKRWERVQRAYDALTLGQGHTAATAQAAVAAAYARNEGDEFVLPTVIGSPDHGRVRSGDAVIFFNYRTDRARQLTDAFVGADFQGFPRTSVPKLHFVTMTRYRDDLPCPVAFSPQSLAGIFPEVVSKAGMRQLRIAETEKYAHVTFFFSGGEEKEYPGERRVLVPSPKVATYDLQPEMSAADVTRLAKEAILSGKYGLVVVNYANPDMVGHTGSLPATVKAVEATDRGVGELLAALDQVGGRALVCADHGNAEQMWDPTVNGPHTAHTLNLVEVFVVGKDFAAGRTKLRTGGRLADLAPTALALMSLPKPAEMTGESLIAG